MFSSKKKRKSAALNVTALNKGEPTRNIVEKLNKLRIESNVN